MKKLFITFTTLSVIFFVLAIYFYITGYISFEKIGQDTDIGRIQSIQVSINTHIYGTSLMLAAFISFVFTIYLKIKINENDSKTKE